MTGHLEREAQAAQPAFGLPGGLQQTFPEAAGKAERAREHLPKRPPHRSHCLLLPSVHTELDCHSHHRLWLNALESGI